MSNSERKYVVDEHNRPPPHCFYGDSWERGVDPWHESAFAGTPAEGFGNRGPINGGWYLLDAFGNQVGFVPDGSIFDAYRRGERRKGDSDE